MDKSYVEARLNDWSKRLDELFKRIDEWYLQLPPTSGMQRLEGRVLQHDEPLMRQFEVLPRMLPTRAILYGKNRLSFVPSALWVIGADGRVNVITNERQFALVDLHASNELPSDWQIVTSRLSQIHLPFDQHVFEELVLHQAVEAA